MANKSTFLSMNSFILKLMKSDKLCLFLEVDIYDNLSILSKSLKSDEF